ncbi:MAG: DUF4395 domain-containing protein [Microbacterium sp.]|uniref:DUF4395 domain-containing protein n=1 Tax=Microbacterium sp. TaxID=51671 RepID=UPI003F9DD46B
MIQTTKIDPRGPRFSAAITSLLLLVTTVFALIGISTSKLPSFGWFAHQPLSSSDFAFIAGDTWAISSASIAQRALDPGFLLLSLIALLFLWGVVSPSTAPWGVIFRRLVRPRLAPPTEWEDPRPPRFAQAVGLVVAATGLAPHLSGVPWALPIAAGAAFIAAFLNAAFAFCLGCQIYLLLQRLGLTGRTAAA